MYIVEREFMLDLIVITTYLSFEKAKQVEIALSGACRIIQEVNSAIVSRRISKSRQMILNDFGINYKKTWKSCFC